MVARKPVNTELSALLKEQHQLKATEKKLKSMIDRINGHLNQLLVEELQLKSRELDHQYPSGTQQIQDVCIKSESNVPPDQINKQELYLNIQHKNLMKSFCSLVVSEVVSFFSLVSGGLLAFSSWSIRSLARNTFD